VRGQRDQGHRGIHSRMVKRCLWTTCHKTFSTTQGTALSRLRTTAETVPLVMTVLAHGGPPQVSVAVFGFDEWTVTRGMARGRAPGQAVQAHRVGPPRDLGQVPVDELRGKQPGGMVGMALARMMGARWWLADEVSAHRDMTRIRRLIERVRCCAAPPPWRVCTAGPGSSIRAICEMFRDAVRTGSPGGLAAARLLSGIG
jgi:hypothetical protein